MLACVYTWRPDIVIVCGASVCICGSMLTRVYSWRPDVVDCGAGVYICVHMLTHVYTWRSDVDNGCLSLLNSTFLNVFGTESVNKPGAHCFD